MEADEDGGRCGHCGQPEAEERGTLTVAHPAPSKKGRARISPEGSHGQVGPSHQGLEASQGQPQGRAVAMASDMSTNIR